jgi:purine-nucleoside phosphorylase
MRRAGNDQVWDGLRDHARRVVHELGEHPVAVVLGTGWAGLADLLGPTAGRLPVDSLPGCPLPTVSGHAGELRSVRIAGTDTLVVAGRCHLYEGHDATDVVHAVRVAVLAGARTVVLTNAAGSIRPEFGVGTAVLLADQLNLTGTSPLIGPLDSGTRDDSGDGGSGDDRFVDLCDLYSSRIRRAVRAQVGPVPEGVYAGLVGPQFETPAEIRALAAMGADLVGMSTVLEAIAAAHLGAEVAGVSLVTNPAAGLTDRIDHREVLDSGARSLEHLVPVVTACVDAA